MTEPTPVYNMMIAMKLMHDTLTRGTEIYDSMDKELTRTISTPHRLSTAAHKYAEPLLMEMHARFDLREQ